MKFKNLMFILSLALVIVSCNKDDGEGGGEENPQNSASSILNSNFTINRQGVFTANPEDYPVDNSIIVSNGASGTVPLRAGDEMGNQIFFDASGSSSQVTAIGMRFGDTGPVTFVPLTPKEIASGVAVLPYLIDSGVCEDIAQICHDIKCYEFALTDAGAISQADLQDIALICGACDEPSCLDLLDPSVCSGIQGEDGSPRFNLTWNGSADLDLYVTDPAGTTISYLNTTSPSGGFLDVDCTGNCPGGNSENITWPNGGPSGTYTFYVNYFSGSGSVPFEILVRDNGQDIRVDSGSVSEVGSDSNTYTYVKN